MADPTQDELLKERAGGGMMPPIGMAMPMAQPAAPAVPTQPASAAAMPLAPSAQPARPAFALPTPKTSLADNLWQKSAGIQNPFERILARAGIGVGKAADIAASSLFPGIAMNIPGTMANTQVANRQQDRRATQEESANAPFELQRDKDLAARDLETQKAEAEQLKTQTQSDTKKDIATTQEEGKNTRSQNTIIGHENIAKMEAENKAAAASGKPQPHITTMVGGQAHVMERDPSTGDYSIDRGIAPPNFAMVAPSLKTIDVLNDQGIPTVQTLSGKTLGASGTGAYGHEEAQAGAVQRAGDELISDIQANKAKLGNVKAIMNAAFLGTPIDDPVSKGLATKLASYAALNPAMHGARGAQAIKQFEQLVGGIVDNPDALIAGIKAIGQTAGTINPNLGHGGGATPPAGAKILTYNPATKKVE